MKQSEDKKKCFEDKHMIILWMFVLAYWAFIPFLHISKRTPLWLSCPLIPGIPCYAHFGYNNKSVGVTKDGGRVA